jgi:hypothetical protein
MKLRLNNDKDTSNHRTKIQEADISFPIIVTEYKDRLVILDGVHRLVKAFEEGNKIIKAKIIPEDFLKSE